MLWRIPADNHEQRIGTMFNLPTNTPYGPLGAAVASLLWVMAWLERTGRKGKADEG